MLVTHYCIKIQLKTNHMKRGSHPRMQISEEFHFLQLIFSYQQTKTSQRENQ